MFYVQVHRDNGPGTVQSDWQFEDLGAATRFAEAAIVDQSVAELAVMKGRVVLRTWDSDNGWQDPPRVTIDQVMLAIDSLPPTEREDVYKHLNKLMEERKCRG